MKQLTPELKACRINLPNYPTPKGNNGAFLIKRQGNRYMIIISDGGGWDHVSVSIKNRKRCPTWEEMCWVKDLFFEPEETAIQFHPAKEDYINNHPYCLHLWRYQGEFAKPPKIMVGL